MTHIAQALSRLRRAQTAVPDLSGPLATAFERSGVRLAAVGGPLEARWEQAVRELQLCVQPTISDVPVLKEGGAYDGTWLESTGTINAEILSRFAPEVAADTFALFAEHQRDDGMIPYKVTADGPAFSQIQLVTPLARSVWRHHQLTASHGVGAPDATWLTTMYEAMERYDHWLATYRDTRGTGGVEAFCTFDTGHDMSPRFWFAADRCLDGDATRFDPELPGIPYVAPDLTATVACQRTYLAEIAEELGLTGTSWKAAARASREALYRHCADAGAMMFYDLDAHGRHVTVDSDVLLRVAACEQLDGNLFTMVLERHLMRTSRFLSHHGFTSIAMDDPRFDADFTRNSWAGPVNFLTQLRAPHAFEHYGHPTELAVATRPLFSALTVADHFPQCMDGWSGTAGYTSVYSPSILWYLDAVERYFGILPTPDGGAWFTGLAPTRLDHGAAEAVAYSRVVGGARYELAADDGRVEVHRDGELQLRFPRGWRVAIDGAGNVIAATGISPRPVTGSLETADATTQLTLAPNERVILGASPSTTTVNFVPPRA